MAGNRVVAVVVVVSMCNYIGW